MKEIIKLLGEILMVVRSINYTLIEEKEKQNTMLIKNEFGKVSNEKRTVL